MKAPIRYSPYKVNTGAWKWLYRPWLGAEGAGIHMACEAEWRDAHTVTIRGQVELGEG